MLVIQIQMKITQMTIVVLCTIFYSIVLLYSHTFVATATIAGAVVGGVAAVGIAVVMVIIAIYFIKKSSKPKGIVANSWIDSQLGSDPFAPAKESSMPRFSGSIL